VAWQEAQSGGRKLAAVKVDRELYVTSNNLLIFQRKSAMFSNHFDVSCEDGSRRIGSFLGLLFLVVALGLSTFLKNAKSGLASRRIVDFKESG